LDNILTTLYNTLRNGEYGASQKLVDALKLESPLYAILSKHTALPQLAMFSETDTNRSVLSVLVFSEKEMAEHEAARLGEGNVFVAEIPKFLINNGEPVDVRRNFFMRCYLLGAEYALMNAEDNSAKAIVPIERLIDKLKKRSMQDDINRHANGGMTFLKQEVCSGNSEGIDLFERTVIAKMKMALYLTPVKDSHPLIFNNTSEAPAIYLFTDDGEVRGVTETGCEFAHVRLDDMISLDNNLMCIINPFSLRFEIREVFCQRYRESR